MSRRDYEVQQRTLAPLLVAGLRMKGRYSDCGAGFSKLAKRIGRYISGKPLLLCHDDDYREDDADYETCFPIREAIEAEGINVQTLPGVRCVTLLHRGPYELLRGSYARVIEHAKQQGHEIATPCREVYLKGPGMIFRGNPKKYLTEIQLPIGG